MKRSVAPKEPEEHSERANLLGLLEALAADGRRTQRHLSAELGMALGLVNVYLNRCIRKGLVKVTEAPARRYAYYVTPKGFAEKSRLTVEYLSFSFSFFRAARADCAELFERLREVNIRRIVLAGWSDLSEIALICALDRGIKVVAVIDQNLEAKSVAGVRAARRWEDVDGDFDGVVVTSLSDAGAIFAKAERRFGAGKVFAPNLLRLRAPSAVPGGDDR